MILLMGAIQADMRFFADVQESWLQVPEFLQLEKEAQSKFIDLMEMIKKEN